MNKIGQGRPALARTGSASPRRRRQSLNCYTPLDLLSVCPVNRGAVHWQQRQLVDVSAVDSLERNNSPHARSGFEGDGDEIMVDAPFVRLMANRQFIAHR